MKTQAVLALLMTGLLMGAGGIGCAKATSSGSKTGTAAPILPPNIPGAPGAVENSWTGNTWASGASVKFNVVSSETFNKWVASHPVDPKDIMLNVNMGQVPNRGTYIGEVKIRYVHNGQAYEATLKSHTETYKGADYFMYNKFFANNGKQVFSGFFEDDYGAIVLVLDGDDDLGDGLGASEYSGSIWFKNFTTSMASYYEGSGWSVVLPCWFREIGPYDCRSNAVMTKNALYPDRYEKLGTFSGLNKAKALNLN